MIYFFRKLYAPVQEGEMRTAIVSLLKVPCEKKTIRDADSHGLPSTHYQKIITRWYYAIYIELWIVVLKFEWKRWEKPDLNSDAA